MERDLPVEILYDILTYAIHGSQECSNILCTNSIFHSIGLRILHQDLVFTSVNQLMRFGKWIAGQDHNESRSLLCEPQTLTLDLAGRTASVLEVYPLGLRGVLDNNLSEPVQFTSLSIFQCLHRVLFHLVRHTSGVGTDAAGRLILETLYLRLNSHSSDSRCYAIEDAFMLVNPRNFIWVGPDPPHHFSIAIVPNAVTPLFNALSTYTRLTNLKLTNIAFPAPTFSDNQSVSLSLPSSSSSSESYISYFHLPIIPTLRTVHLGQATFLSAPTIASYILDTITVRYDEPTSMTLRSPGLEDDRNMENSSPTRASRYAELERITLVDVYEGSIWGLRLRMPHIITAALFLADRPEYRNVYEGRLGPGSASQDLKERIKDVVEALVSVEVKTERIMGGDRGA
ncbi:hypothetical protein D9758_010032 [Tetrapyrgos nigripes]|uniref:Uncharacterized protein n=1 Tax=Tetrapyrgos nigripes TaxID=182062 RepID=A0A8H5CU85_9AGAR|nr:hypothetical protein D9758_010032 [Tetrapyrgos nigripes]